MKKRIDLIVIFLLMAICSELCAQCYPDRHNSNIENSWISCSTSNSPNVSRDKGHWILYEFDERKKINSIQIWNINHPDHLRSGAKTIALDYKDVNGIWKSKDAFTIDQGEGSGFYEGQVIDILDNITSNQVLLHILDNYGGQCSGIAEVKFNISETTTPTQDIAEDHFQVTITPNPFYQQTFVTIDDLHEKKISYEVINGLGQIIQKNTATTLNGRAQFELIAEGLSSGNYYLKIIDGHRVSSRKLSHQNP